MYTLYVQVVGFIIRVNKSQSYATYAPYSYCTISMYGNTVLEKKIAAQVKNLHWHF